MRKLVPLVLLAVLFLAGCYPGSPITIPGQVPIIESFNANPANISAGGSSSLDWTVSGATSVSIDQGIGSVALTGSRAVSPSVTTTYTLTASSSSGTVNATTQVIVSGSVPTPTGLPVINSFTASPSIVNLGDSTNLSWNVTNAASVSINNGVGPVGSSGNTFVSPSTTTTYMLTASNANGSLTATALVQVTELPYPSGLLPAIDYFNATPPIISSGGSSFLRWGTSNATSVTIDNGIGPVADHGTMLVSPPYSIVYTLTASNSYGYTTRTLSISVSGGGPPPSTFAVTSVTASVSPPSYIGSCPHQFNFSAVITANGPGMVTYKWERSDNALAPVQSITFSSAGSQVVTDYWDLGGDYSGWERVRILTPNSVVSNQAIFILTCL